MRNPKQKICFIFISLASLVEVGGCHAAPKIELTVACLNDSYAAFQTAATTDERSSIASKYLYCFPSTFSEFEALFGYDMQTKVASPLYPEYLKYFNFIGQNYEFFDKTAFSKKFIDLAIDARGSDFSDAEELLQITSLAPLKRDPDIGFSILSKHSDSEIRSYWNFVLDTLVPRSKKAIYSCPTLYMQTKACRVLSDIRREN